MEASNSIAQNAPSASVGELRDSELESIAGGNGGIIEMVAFAIIVNILDNQAAAEAAISRGYNMVR